MDDSALDKYNASGDFDVDRVISAARIACDAVRDKFAQRPSTCVDVPISDTISIAAVTGRTVVTPSRLQS